MDDSVQGPTTMKKHKIKDRETWESGAATYSISQKETTKSTTMLMLQWKSYKILFPIFLIFYYFISAWWPCTVCMCT